MTCEFQLFFFVFVFFVDYNVSNCGKERKGKKERERMIESRRGNLS
jgi:hypothetical protein